MYYYTGCNHCLISIMALMVVATALTAVKAPSRAGMDSACSPLNDSKITLCDE